MFPAPFYNLKFSCTTGVHMSLIAIWCPRTIISINETTDTVLAHYTCAFKLELSDIAFNYLTCVCIKYGFRSTPKTTNQESVKSIAIVIRWISQYQHFLSITIYWKNGSPITNMLLIYLAIMGKFGESSVIRQTT